MERQKREKGKDYTEVLDAVTVEHKLLSFKVSYGIAGGR
jgi:hypothetical protein